mgnify:FL=1
MRVFVDANTLISAIVFRGQEHEVLKLAMQKKVELITSESVIEEVLDVLQRKFPSKVGLVEEFLKLSEIQVILKNDYTSTIESQVVRDLEDRHVLAGAINSNCKFIVTGDKDLKVLKNYKGIEIVTSRKLLEMTNS